MIDRLETIRRYKGQEGSINHGVAIMRRGRSNDEKRFMKRHQSVHFSIGITVEP